MHQVTFLRGAEATFKLGTKSWFGDVGLAHVTPLWACYFFLTISLLDQTLSLTDVCDQNLRH